MDEGPYTACEGCRERVDAADPNVIRAFPQIEMRTFGGTQWADGIAELFHQECFPGGSGYRVDRERLDLG